MNIQKNISLKSYNTFGINVYAKRFVSVNSLKELKAIIETEKDIFLLSGGSNILLTTDINKLVVHLNLKGIIVNDTEKDVVYERPNLVKTGTNLFYGVSLKTLED